MVRAARLVRESGGSVPTRFSTGQMMTMFKRSLAAAAVLSMSMAACSSGNSSVASVPTAVSITVASSIPYSIPTLTSIALMNESSVAPITSSTPQTSSSPSPTTTIQTASRARCGKAGTGTITLWEIFGGDVAKLTFASLVQKFNDTHPGVTLVTTSVGGFIDLRKKLQALSPDQWPDVVVTSPTALSTMIGSGLVIPPRECAGDTAERGLLPVINATYSIDGVVQAAPYGVSTPVLMFDANEARRAGLDPDHPPKTLDALRAASLQVVSTGVSPHGLVVSDHYGEFMVFQGSSQRGDLVASPNDGHSSGPESVHLVTQSNIDAMKWLAARTTLPRSLIPWTVACSRCIRQAPSVT
jgi:ABC-type glycerol-3-phosphate transport system substrate-binding protein